MSKLQRKVERYEGLFKLGQLTASSLDIKDILKKACPKISKLLQCEKVLIYRLDEKKNQLFHIHHHDRTITETRFNLDDHSFIGECGHYMATKVVENAGHDIRLLRESDVVKKMDVTDMLLFPMVSKGELLGVIQAINSENEYFNEEDIHYSEAIANQMTVVLQNAILFEKQQKMIVQIVESMADAIGKKDTYTGGHTKRVRHFSEMIGREMDMSFTDMADLRLASVLHDIGKIGIEDKILKKKAPLSEKEFEIMRNHPRYGYEILKKIEGLDSVIDGVKLHHERPDGKGYPYGLKGDKIPLIAAIISVADTFDAMISTRPYRKGLPPMVAYQEILDYCGTQFDERVVEAFSRAFKKSSMYKETLVDNIKKAG